MVVYDLICDLGHDFEGWFKSSADFLQQESAEQIICPACESNNIRKLPSASYLSTSKTGGKMPQPEVPEAQKIARALTNYLVKNTDDVGQHFAEEAKKIHYGEVEARSIRGFASKQEVESLSEEGIDVISFPGKLTEKNKLN